MKGQRQLFAHKFIRVEGPRQERGMYANIMRSENPITEYSEREWSRSKTKADFLVRTKKVLKDLGGRCDYGRPYILG